MSALSKAIIEYNLSTDLNLPKAETRKMLEEFFEAIRGALETGQHVKLSGFGNFILRDKPQRPGRNPKTGEKVPIDARRVVTFKSGLKLKKRIEPHIK